MKKEIRIDRILKTVENDTPSSYQVLAGKS